MSRPKELSEEQKKKNRKEIEERKINYRPPLHIKNKLIKLSQSTLGEINLNKILDNLITTHPKFRSFKEI